MALGPPPPSDAKEAAVGGKHYRTQVETHDERPASGGISAAGVVIGVIGCVIITASSVYTALKMGALSWPAIFTSVTALVLLRALGHRSLNEANVTQIIVSAGSMVAVGRARQGELGHDDTGIIVASGLLGGESIVGVVIALATVVAGLLG